MKYFTRFILLVGAFALTTAGLMGWQDHGFGVDGLWPLEGPLRLHPLHLLMVGLAMIPPALWEIFLLERDFFEPRAPGSNPAGPTDRPR
jgi:hypothetical protein